MAVVSNRLDKCHGLLTLRKMTCIILDATKWRSQDTLGSSIFYFGRQAPVSSAFLDVAPVVTGKPCKTADPFSSSFCLLITEILLAMPIHQPTDGQFNCQGFAEY